MLSFFARAFGQLGDPAIRRVLLKSLALTLLLFAAAAVLIGWLLTGTNPCGIGPLDYRCELGSDAGAAAALDAVEHEQLQGDDERGVDREGDAEHCRRRARAKRFPYRV